MQKFGPPFNRIHFKTCRDLWLTGCSTKLLWLACETFNYKDRLNQSWKRCLTYVIAGCACPRFFLRVWQHGGLLTTLHWPKNWDHSLLWIRRRVQEIIWKVWTVCFHNKKCSAETERHKNTPCEGKMCVAGKIQERHRRRMVRMVTDKPQTTYRELQEHLAADGIVVHRSTIQRTLHQEKLIGRVMHKKPFLSVCHEKSRIRYAKDIWTSQKHFGKKYCDQMRLR